MPGRRAVGETIAAWRVVVTLSGAKGAMLGYGPFPLAALGVRATWASLQATLKRIAGMPDYDAYLDHLRRRHPERPLPTEREFYDDFVRARYSDGPTRCC